MRTALRGVWVAQVPEPLVGGDKALQAATTVGLGGAELATEDSSQDSQEVFRRLEIPDVACVMEGD